MQTIDGRIKRVQKRLDKLEGRLTAEEKDVADELVKSRA